MTNETKTTPNIENLLTGLTIFVVDESKAFTSGLVAILEPFKCEVSSFNTTKSVLDKLLLKTPDIIITDYEMSPVNGLDLIDAIRSNKNFDKILILALIGSNEPEIPLKTILRGANIFLNKSGARDFLIAQLVSLAKIRSLSQEILRLKEFKELKILIGTHKHDLGNVLAIIDGKFRKLERNHPVITTDDCGISVKKNLERLEKTIQDLGHLRNYDPDRKEN